MGGGSTAEGSRWQPVEASVVDAPKKQEKKVRRRLRPPENEATGFSRWWFTEEQKDYG